MLNYILESFHPKFLLLFSSFHPPSFPSFLHSFLFYFCFSVLERQARDCPELTLRNELGRRGGRTPNYGASSELVIFCFYSPRAGASDRRAVMPCVPSAPAPVPQESSQVLPAAGHLTLLLEREEMGGNGGWRGRGERGRQDEGDIVSEEGGTEGLLQEQTEFRPRSFRLLARLTDR